ncbi:MAG: RNB domain-containing ribonuclease [Akkermansia muciniphila]|nr:RNB domain-containing ribonuclease [Akkermansia muciniphila]
MNTEERLLALLRSPQYSPLDQNALARALEIPSRERAAFRATLRRMEETGMLLRVRRGAFVLRRVTEDAPLRGRVRRVSPTLLLFVADAEGQERLHRLLPQEEGEIALRVEPRRAHGAMDGDTVRASVSMVAPPGYRRRHRGHRPGPEDLQPELRIEEVTERKRGFWVGIYRTGGRFGYMVGDGSTAPELVRLVQAPPANLQEGMSICVQILTLPVGPHSEATGRVAEVLGFPDEAGVCLASVIRKYSLPECFPKAVPEEVEGLPEDPSAEETDGRFRSGHPCVITIDPEDARDFDDAFSLLTTPEGWELAVHIADVSHYVHPGSALDAEARRRGNSTYLPGRVIPMLPPRLCDGLCSLLPGRPRLTKLCLIRFAPDGSVLSADFRDSFIVSCCRLNYQQALRVLQGEDSSGLPQVDAMLREADRLAEILRSRRLSRGALDLDLPQTRVLVDEQGQPTEAVTEVSDPAHHLIEEFMLAANQCVAQALRTRLLPAIYRVHEQPDPAKLHEFALLAASYGISAGSLNNRRDLVAVLEAIKVHPQSYILLPALLRSLMRARYSPHPLGHFGLAIGDYCHFTSPIRRYADLIVHRAFSRLLGQRSPLPSPAELTDIADHISETERNSAAAEAEATHALLEQLLARRGDT